MVDRLLLNTCSDGSSTTATPEILGGGKVVQELDRRKPLNMCSPTGWKWAQREDALWMVNDWSDSENRGTIWGLDKDVLKGVER